MNHIKNMKLIKIMKDETYEVVKKHVVDSITILYNQYGTTLAHNVNRDWCNKIFKEIANEYDYEDKQIYKHLYLLYYAIIYHLLYVNYKCDLKELYNVLNDCDNI